MKKADVVKLRVIKSPPEIRIVEVPHKRLMSVKEVAEYIGWRVESVWNRTGRKAKRPFPVKPRRIGRRVMFEKKEVDAWIDSL